SSIVSAERRHRTVVRPRAAEEEIVIVAAELRRCERAEDELLRDAEEVERPAPLLGVECAECRPAFAIHEPPLQLACDHQVATTGGGFADGALGERARGTEGEGTDAVADVRLG